MWGKPGKDGANANLLVLDLSNDVDQIFVDSKGVVTKDYTLTTDVTLYLGNSAQEITDISLGSVSNILDKDGKQITPERSGNTVTLKIPEGSTLSSLETKKLYCNITAYRTATDDNDALLGTEKTATFKIIALTGNIDYDLVPSHSVIKYALNEDLGKVELSTQEFSIGIRKTDINTGVPGPVSYDGVEGLTIKYKKDKGSDLTSVNGNPVFNSDNMPKQFAEFYLYRNDLEGDDNYIDCVTVECLYDASLPVIYQMTCDKQGILTTNTGSIESTLNLGIKKTIGGSGTVHYTTYDKEALSGLSFRMYAVDTENQPTGCFVLHFENDDDNPPMVVNVLDYLTNVTEYKCVVLELLSTMSEGDDQESSEDNTYTVLDTLTLYNTIQGKNGADAPAVFKSTAFYRGGNTVPTTPEGGSYKNPTPTTSGWSDGVPAAKEDPTENVL